MIQDKINKIIPYINTEFISYNTAEYGNYTPFVSFWINKEIHKSIFTEIKRLFNSNGYVLDKDYRSEKIDNFVVYPKFIHRDNGTIIYKKENWSIEEMLDLIIKVLENK